VKGRLPMGVREAASEWPLEPTSRRVRTGDKVAPTGP
jgi:hypothetical protein